MIDLMQEACEWLGEKRTEEMARTITYTRPGTELTAEVDATAGQNAAPAVTESGLVVEFQGQDWLLLAEDLAAFGEPQSGDRIRDESSGTALEYEVLPPADGEQPWRWSGRPGVTMRIHSKQVPATSN